MMVEAQNVVSDEVGCELLMSACEDCELEVLLGAEQEKLCTSGCLSVTKKIDN